MKIAVVGATGMVGKVMLQVLKEERMNITQLIPVASEKSIGSTIAFDGNNFEIVGLNKERIVLTSIKNILSSNIYKYFIKNNYSLINWNHGDLVFVNNSIKD